MAKEESNEMSDEQIVEKELGLDVETDEIAEEQAAEATESDLAEKALESSEESAESAEAQEDKVPLSKYMATKNRAKDAELENARLQGELQGIEKATAKTEDAAVALSPVQKEMAAQEVNSEDELDLTGAEAMKLMRAETAFEKKQEDTKAVQTNTQTVKQAQATSYREAIDANDIEGLDFKTIVTEGEKLLTRGEGIDLGDMTDGFGDAVYKKCLNAIIRKGGDRAEELQKLVDAQKPETKPEEEEVVEEKTVTKKKVAKKKTNRDDDDLDAKLLESEDEGGDEDDQPSSAIMNHMFG